MATTQSVASSEKTSTIKEIYILQGDEKQGKSSTIKEIYRILSMKYLTIKNEDDTIYVESKPYEYDITIVIKIKIKGKDVSIGIESFGDEPKRIKRSIKLFAKMGCNIVFCAERTGLSISIEEWAKKFSKSVTPLPVSKLKGKLNKNEITEAETSCEIAKNIIQQADLINRIPK